MTPATSAPAGTGLDLDVIEARAKAATQGPWKDSSGCVASETTRHAERYNYDDEQSDRLTVARCGDTFVPRMGMPDDKVAAANAAHTAGMDPPTTLALVAELRLLREANVAMLEGLKPFSALASVFSRDGEGAKLRVGHDYCEARERLTIVDLRRAAALVAG